jgi:small subunit ribosomal protein S4
MSRYRGPRLRITRRLGDLPGLVRKSYGKTNPPGQHGANPQKPSQYSIRLKEKQKLRFNYGVNEKQLVNYVKKARRSQGSTGEKLLQLLEMRLDTIIFRSGFAPTLRAARQLVTHGHICVNNEQVTIPSYQCKPGDSFVVKNKKASRQLVQSYFDQTFGPSLQSNDPKVVTSSAISAATGTSPSTSYLKFDPKNFSGEVKQFISRNDVGCPVNEFLIIEYYSRKV